MICTRYTVSDEGAGRRNERGTSVRWLLRWLSNGTETFLSQKNCLLGAKRRPRHRRPNRGAEPCLPLPSRKSPAEPQCPQRRHDFKRSQRPPLNFPTLPKSSLLRPSHRLSLALTHHHCSLNASLATHRRSARRSPPRDYGSRGGAVGLRQRERQARVLRERIHSPPRHCRCGVMCLVADRAIVVGVPHLPGQQQLCIQIRQHDQDC
jgi:hypothetical protein